MQKAKPETGDGKAEERNISDGAKTTPLPSSSRYSWKNILSPLELRTLSTSLTVLGLMILLISLCTDNWLSDTQVGVGLWGACMQPVCPIDPELLAWEKETITVTRSMLILAVLCGCVACPLISISFFRNRISSFSLGFISGIFSFAASLFVMIGMSVYTSRMYEDKMELIVEAEWSFDAGWVSFPLFFLAGAATIVLSYVER